MMLLYVCKECGRWCDASIGEALSRAFSAFSTALSGKAAETPPGCQCPDGHGAMVNVSQEERLFAWTPQPGEDARLAGVVLLTEKEE
jgi:hypothetical protein